MQMTCSNILRPFGPGQSRVRTRMEGWSKTNREKDVCVKTETKQGRKRLEDI